MANNLAAHAMRQHHAQMVADLKTLAQKLGDDDKPWEVARSALVSYVEDEVAPHAAAEETTLYEQAYAFAQLKALIRAMRYEHQVLAELSQRLRHAAKRDDAQRLSTALATLFAVHAEKENRFIIGGLEPRADVDLHAILQAMHAELPKAEHPAGPRPGT